jgi:hypothetical protein
MSDNSASDDFINNISTAAIAYRAKRPHYDGPLYPIPDWHREDSSMIVSPVTPFAVIKALVEGRLLIEAYEACEAPPEFDEAWSDTLEAAYAELVEQGLVP